MASSEREKEIYTFFLRESTRNQSKKQLQQTLKKNIENQ